MRTLPTPLLEEITAVLHAAGRDDLVRCLRSHTAVPSLSSGQAARALGVSSPNTVKNWLHAGRFPGAFQTAGGHWRFPADEVEAIRKRMLELAERNRAGDLTPPDTTDDEPPLL